MKSLLWGLVGLSLLGLAVAVGYFQYWLNTPLDLPEEGLEYRLEPASEGLRAFARLILSAGR